MWSINIEMTRNYAIDIVIMVADFDHLQPKPNIFLNFQILE